METLTQKFNKTSLILIATVLVVGSLMPLLSNRRAHALPTLQSGSFVRLDRLVAGVVTGGRVCVKPQTTIPNSGTIIVNFPTQTGSDYTLDTTVGVGHWVTNTTFESGFTGAQASILNNRASSVSGHAVTFTLGAAGSIASGTLTCFNWDTTGSPLTTGGATASNAVTAFAYIKTQNASFVDLDQTYWGVDIISGDTVSVNAQVAPYFTLFLSGSTDNFSGFLSSASVNSTAANARYFQVDSNARNGWIVWVKDTNFKGTNATFTGDTGSANKHGALTSVMAGGYAIGNGTTNYLATPNASSTHTLAGGTDDYALAATINAQGTGSGTTSINGVYDGSTANQGGVLDPTQYRPVASSTGTAVAAKVNIKMLTTIGVSTPPGTDYTDTLEYVGAGQF